MQSFRMRLRLSESHPPTSINKPLHSEPLSFSDEWLAMNKAFVRESDHDLRHFLFCGSLRQAVERVTFDA